MDRARPENRRGRSGWTGTRGSETRTFRRCAYRAKNACGTRIWSTPDAGGPPPPPHTIHPQPEHPRPAAEPPQAQWRTTVRSTLKPPHRSSRRGWRESVSPHRQSPSCASVQINFKCGNHDAGAHPQGAAGEVDVATTAMPTGRNWDVTDTQVQNFDTLGHRSQLDRTASRPL